ncbi:MAG: aldo/keto reductase [Planctomycetota bacterium]
MDSAARRYERMEYRRCGRSGLKLPAVSLGAWQAIGSYRATDESRAIIHTAFDRGITHFDFANNYGDPPGSSEELFGRILPELPRDELIISTKAGYKMWPGPYGDWGSRKYIVASCDASLKRLGVDYVDIFYHHRYDPDTPLAETMGALETLVHQGKALYVGLSNYHDPSFTAACELMDARGWSPVTIHQPRYNLIDRRAAQSVLPTAAERGVGVICFSPLAQGLLTDRYLAGVPDDSRAAVRGGGLADRLTPELVQALRELDALARDRGQSLAELALAWLLRDERVTSVLIGASRVEHIRTNVEAPRQTGFADDELARIDAICERIL